MNWEGKMSILLKGKGLRWKGDGRDWDTMNAEAWRQANGLCEWCRKPLPYGTPAAHIIPRKKSDPTLDEAWNLALMGFTGCNDCFCHTRFDLNRAKAVEEMEAAGGTVLSRRIQNHPRLRAEFKRRRILWESKK